MKKRGKLIVLYGINNLGKTTQTKLLVDKIKTMGIDAEYLKYPIYDLRPTGPRLNEILRNGKKQNISEIELQEIYAQNRRDFQPILQKNLGSGKYIIAEDYIGTGIAWGVAKKADMRVLEEQNKDLLKEDVAILLDGYRFMKGKENNHLHESKDDLMKKCREIHLQLAQKYNWIKINANQSIDNVHNDIWNAIKKNIL